MPASSASHSHGGLLAFNQQLIAQALALVAAHDGPGQPAYAGAAGSHLRHVIEHYDALVFAAQPGFVDYDGRARDLALEISPTLARQRLHLLRSSLRQWPPALLDRPVRVRGLAGVTGEHHFGVDSSLGRELAFVASHTVHHFALLAPYCQQHAISTGAHFGHAPGSVKHHQLMRSTPCAASTAATH